MVLDEIFKNAELTSKEAEEVMEILDDEEKGEFYDTAGYQKLYEYFCNTGEMPIGVAKARTGDPDLWILEYLTDMISSGDVLSDIAEELAKDDDGPGSSWGKQIWEMT